MDENLLPRASSARVPDVALRTVMLTVFLDVVADSILTPMLALYAKHSFKATDTQVGYLFSISGVAAFFCSSIVAMLANRFGRKPVFVLSLLGSFIAAMIQGFALNYEMLLVGRAIGGGLQVVATTAKVYINEATAWDLTGKACADWNSWFGVAQNMGRLFGPGLGGALAHYGLNVPSIATMVVEIFGTMLAGFYIVESPTFLSQKATRSAEVLEAPLRESKVRDPHLPVLLWCLATMLTNGCGRLTESTFALFGIAKYSLGPTDIGFIFLLGAVAAIFASRWQTVVFQKVGLRNAAIVCCSVHAMSTAALPFMPAVPNDSNLSVWQRRAYFAPLVLCFMVASAAFSMAIFMINLLGKDFHDQPTIQSRGFMFRSVGKVVMPIAGSRLLSVDLAYPWLLGAAVAAASAPICYVLHKLLNSSPVEQSSASLERFPSRFGSEWKDEELSPAEKSELGEFMAELLKKKHLRWRTMRKSVEELLDNTIPEMPIESRDRYHESLYRHVWTSLRED